MNFPIFNNSRSPFPLNNAERVGMDSLDWILQNDPKLKEITEAVRLGEVKAKSRLGVTCLGGPYQGLPPYVDHGKCVRWHISSSCHIGYRNTQHIDWNSRNGIVLIDIDNISEDVRAVRFLLEKCADAIVVMWVSARGKGLKVGVGVNPIPVDTLGNYDAWAVAYHYITNILRQAGLRVGEHFRVDQTIAAAQVSILSHDPGAIVRNIGNGQHQYNNGRAPAATPSVPVGVSDRVTWAPGERSTAPKPIRIGVGGRGGLPEGAVTDDYLLQLMNHAINPMQLIEYFPWQEGYRSSSMFTFGTRCALRGFDFHQGRRVAYMQAMLTEMAAEYGIDDCLRHYDRGWYGTDEMLLDFPATG